MVIIIVIIHYYFILNITELAIHYNGNNLDFIVHILVT